MLCVQQLLFLLLPSHRCRGQSGPTRTRACQKLRSTEHPNKSVCRPTVTGADIVAHGCCDIVAVAKCKARYANRDAHTMQMMLECHGTHTHISGCLCLQSIFAIGYRDGKKWPHREHGPAPPAAPRPGISPGGRRPQVRSGAARRDARARPEAKTRPHSGVFPVEGEFKRKNIHSALESPFCAPQKIRGHPGTPSEAPAKPRIFLRTSIKTLFALAIS